MFKGFLVLTLMLSGANAYSATPEKRDADKKEKEVGKSLQESTREYYEAIYRHPTMKEIRESYNPKRAVQDPANPKVEKVKPGLEGKLDLIGKKSREKAATLKLAQDKLRTEVKDEKTAKLLDKYLNAVADAMLAEGDQRNSIFTQDKIVETFQSLVNSDDAITQLGLILDVYSQEVKGGKVASHSTLIDALTKHITAQRKDLSDDAKKELVAKIERDCALFSIGACYADVPSASRIQ
jgi:hypothetical protein